VAVENRYSMRYFALKRCFTRDLREFCRDSHHFGGEGKIGWILDGFSAKIRPKIWVILQNMGYSCVQMIGFE